MENLVFDGERLLALTKGEVISIPRQSGKAAVLARGLDEAHAFAIGANHIYIAERGDPYWRSADSGYLAQVPRAGGKTTRLVGPVLWPEGVAVIGEQVFVGLHNGDILVTDPSGRAVTKVVDEERSDPCRRTTWREAIDGALYWLRVRSDVGGRGILWRYDPT